MAHSTFAVFYTLKKISEAEWSAPGSAGYVALEQGYPDLVIFSPADRAVDVVYMPPSPAPPSGRRPCRGSGERL